MPRVVVKAVPPRTFVVAEVKLLLRVLVVDSKRQRNLANLTIVRRVVASGRALSQYLTGSVSLVARLGATPPTAAWTACSRDGPADPDGHKMGGECGAAPFPPSDPAPCTLGEIDGELPGRDRRIVCTGPTSDGGRRLPPRCSGGNGPVPGGHRLVEDLMETS